MAGELAVEMRLGRDVQVPRPTPLTGGGQHQLLLNAEGKCRSHGLSFRGKIILSGHVGFGVYTALSVSGVNLGLASIRRSGSEAHDLRHP